ncbi:MAG: hypothetical protein HFE63_08135 [Clostridiales bacterium]|nr:hypothetical protein [Clostridiales bacterium]
MNNNNDNKAPDGFKLPTQIVFCIAIFGFGIVSALNPLGVAGLPLSIIAAAMLTTFALTLADKYVKIIPLFAISILSYLASAYIYKSYGLYTTAEVLAISIAALFPAILALPIYITVRLKQGRAVSIAASAITASLLWIAYAALSIRAEYGVCTLDNFRMMIDEAFEPVRQMLASLTYEHNGEAIAYYNNTDIEQLIYSVKTILLGSLTAAMMIISYFVTLVSRLIANSFDIRELFPYGMRIRIHRTIKKTDDGKDYPALEIHRDKVQWRIQLDSVTAIVYIIAYLVSVLFASSNGVQLSATIAAQNIIVILAPGFIYAGIREVFGGFGTGAPTGAKGCIIIPFAFILLFINPMTLFILFSVMGVISTLRENRRRKSE